MIRPLVISALLLAAVRGEDEPSRDKVRELTPVPATEENIDAAIRRGVDFLVANQNPNGSWGGPTLTKDLNIYAPLPGAHHAFRAGASGLAMSGLLDSHDDRPEVKASLDRAAAWTRENLPKLRRADQTTTYNVWGHAYGLRAMTRFWEHETDPAKKAEWQKLGQEQIELVGRSEDVNGGWGYLDLFDDLTTKKPSGTPTSFTTATVLLSMAEAKRVMNVKLDDKLVEHALVSLRRQRTPDFSYLYSLSFVYHPRAPINRPAGSLGRSQACNAALRTYDGDKLVTNEVLDTWAGRFLDRQGFLDNGRERPVPHEAPFQIAGYFYYYGIYYFTESAKFLPKEKQAAYAKRLSGLLLTRQQKDGSWWDYPLYNYHRSYGTGYALMSLAWCREAMKP
ncbi:hypothetical protein KBB96_16495 [Luteolibacter ambystomatis]|uniref:Squalene cyclase C-terminal domain-containing protein n=1 Tax=Luteolibacter ambystomatis TaxID=2824561 RepID=A0A975G8W4_9BACT|nr:hypothetical protein [Luteolibacter ambystomatis]QUE50455.1 hypothetical protein KBB96_16495 [Luteolibacter ambystomatis]